MGIETSSGVCRGTPRPALFLPAVAALGVLAETATVAAQGTRFPGASEPDRATERRYRGPFSGPGLALEPFVGLQTFAETMGLEDQNVAGVRAGFDLGPFVGLRGFYWRGVNDDLDGWEGMEAYGGEARFSLGGPVAFSPHLLAGAGRMKFDRSFGVGGRGVAAERTTLVLGGGVALGLGSRVRLSVDARDHLIAQPDLDRADGKDPAYRGRNWQMSAGLKILLGGGRGAGHDGPVTVRGPRIATGPYADGRAVVGEVPARAEGTDGTTPAAAAPEEPAAASDVARGGAVAAPVPARRGSVEPAAPAPPVSIVVIPIGFPAPGVPEVVGDSLGASAAGAMTADLLRDIVRTEVARAIAEHRPEPARSDPAPVGVTRDDLEATERRLADLVESRLEEMRRALGGIARSVPAGEPGRTGPSADGEEPPGEPETAPTRLDPSLGFPARELRPYASIQLGDDVQWVFGLAADLGPSDTFRSLDIVPEVSVGVGRGRTAWMIAANLQYRFTKVFERETFWVGPLAALGLGLLNQDGSEIVLNLLYGANVQLRRVGGVGGDRLNLFVAHQGVDLFRRDRVVVGLSLER